MKVQKSLASHAAISMRSSDNHSNVITRTNSTTEHTEDERLSANVWSSSVSDGESWYSPVIPQLERNSARWTSQLQTLPLRGAEKKKKKRGIKERDIRVQFPNSDKESDESFPDNENACDDGHSIFGTRDLFYPQKIFHASEEVFASTEELCSVDFSLFPLLWKQQDCLHLFLFYALADIVICFFETDLSLLICLSMIKVKWKEVITMTSICYLCKTLKLLKRMISLGWKEINLCLMVGKDFNGSMLDEKTITHRKGP